MDNIFVIKILIVGLTTVLALTSFNRNEFTDQLMCTTYKISSGKILNEL